MDNCKSRYVRHLAISVGLVFCAHALLQIAGFAPADNADRTVLIMVLLLGALTALAATRMKDEEPGHVTASRLLAMAAATVTTMLAAMHLSGHVILLLGVFLVGIPYVVYALRKEIDDHVAPLFLLFTTAIQSVAIILIVC